MTTTAERWRNLSGQLTETINAVPADKWDAPAPCESWVARDVVQHLVEWMPGLYLSSAGLPPLERPSVADDPAAAWAAADDAIQSALDDPEIAKRTTKSQAGEMTLEALVEMTGLSDLLIHRWDLARATGQDETLDPDEVHVFWSDWENLPPEVADAMVASGHYKPAITLPDDADEQSRLLAAFGRTP